VSMSYAQIYEFERAIEQGLLALEYEPNNTNNLFIQGELYERIDDYENAEKYMLQSLLFQNQSLDKEYVKLASVYNRQQKYKEGIEAYKRAIEENPEDEKIQFLLIFTKDQYYKDIDTRIGLYENFKNKFPESKYKDFIDYRITELKEEKFLIKD